MRALPKVIEQGRLDPRRRKSTSGVDNSRLWAAMLGSVALLAASSASAQFAVVDVAAVKQVTTTALQSVLGVAKQVQQYQLQLQQYQNAIQNTVSAPSQIYGQVQNGVKSTQGSMDGFTKLVPTGQSSQQYLSQFTNNGGMNGSTDLCATEGLCSAAQLTAAANAAQTASQARDVGLVTGSQTELTALQGSANNLQNISTAAQGATGQMQALGYDNQINALNAGATLHMASMMALQTQQQAADRLAGQQAAVIQMNNDRAAVQAYDSTMSARFATQPSGHYELQAAGLTPVTGP
jgi:P-type conjugative transfer protein TrbJ